MTKIVNEARILDDEKTTLLRGAIEHRATWMGLMYLEAKKMGYDAEKFMRAAVRKTGHIHGERIKSQVLDPEDMAYFKEIFLNPGVINYFEMEVKELDKDNLRVEFNYCPLVHAWQKLGIDDETCAILCDIAMDGDRGIAEVMGYKFDLTDTIAQGCATCKLHFHK